MTQATEGFDKSHVVAWGRSVLQLESAALTAAAERLDGPFAEAVAMLLACQGKVVVSGLGKSGHVAAKIASTLSSTGTASFYLHPSEALHGDFGMLGPGDCLIALAFGGETREVLAVAKYARNLNVPVIAVTGYLDSSLALASDVVLDGSIASEADTLGLAPTSSSTLALALGDALAVAVMRCRGFTRENFASLHPGGRLGRSLAKVYEWMHPAAELPFVHETTDFHSVLEAVTTPNFGLIAVLSREQGKMVGVISDGDLRRALLMYGGRALEMRAGGLMNRQPKTIDPQERVVDAISLMEKHKITGLFAVDPASQEVAGLVRLHDLLAAKII